MIVTCRFALHNKFPISSTNILFLSGGGICEFEGLATREEPQCRKSLMIGREALVRVGHSRRTHSLAFTQPAVLPPTVTIAMEDVEKALGSVIYNLNDANYARSLASCRSLFEIGQTYYRFPSDLIFNAIWNNRPMVVPSMSLRHGGGLIHRNSHLIVRLASDAESDHVLAPYSSGLQSRLCARSLQEFFSYNIGGAWSMEVAGYWNDSEGGFYADTNLVTGPTTDSWRNPQSAITSYSHLSTSLIQNCTITRHKRS